MKEPIAAIVGRRLSELMLGDEKLNSQQKLGRKTGIGQTTIGRIRRGEVSATVENLRAIADAFGVTIGDLCGEGTVEPKSSGQWPFSFTLQEYLGLPEREKGRIEGYAEKIIEDAARSRKQAAAG